MKMKTCYDCVFRKTKCKELNKYVSICSNFKQICQDCLSKKAVYIYDEVLICEDCLLDRMDICIEEKITKHYSFDNLYLGNNIKNSFEDIVNIVDVNFKKIED